MNLSPEALDVVIRTVVGEASNQGADGMAAVMWTILNRANWQPAAWWGHDVEVVCRKFEQYSAWLPGADRDRITRMQPTAAEYIAAQNVILGVLAGHVADLTRGSTTYKVRGTKASWDHAVADTPPLEIGAHSFWRLSPTGPCMAFLDDPTQQVA